MAEKRYSIRIYENTQIADLDFTDAAIKFGNRTKAVFEAPGGDRYIFQGTGFTYDEGLIDQGKITSLCLVDNVHGIVQRIFDFRIDAGQITGDNIEEFVATFASRVVVGSVNIFGSDGDDRIASQEGNDILVGGKGEDTITGYAGRDRLTGGKGNDVFVFAPGSGKDTITDFAAGIREGVQDLIDANFPNDGIIARSGKNTTIDFGNGDVVTLLGVKPGQIDGGDFAVGW